MKRFVIGSTPDGLPSTAAQPKIAPFVAYFWNFSLRQPVYGRIPLPTGPRSVALGKQAFYTQIDLDQPKAYAYAKEVMSMNALAADAQEGISAFLEKRRAYWTGK